MDERNATRLLAHEVWNAVADDLEVESALSDLQTFGLVCEVRDLEVELSISQAENARLTKRVAELHQAIIKVSNETPFSDEAKDALAQRGVLLAKIGTLEGLVVELTAAAAHANKATADLERELHDANADRAELQSILDHMDTLAV